MDEQEQQALIKVIERLEASVIDNQAALSATRYVVQLLCKKLSPAQTESMLRQLQEAREVLTATREPTDQHIAQHFSLFELVMSGMASPVLH